MKNTLCSFLLCTTFMYFAGLNAQTPWYVGGNTLTANGTLGTNSSHSLVFETANTQRGILTSTGLWHLGGTTTPAARVQITHNSTAGTSPHLLLYEPANDYTRFYFKNTNTTNYFGIAAAPATTNSSARLNFLYSASGIGDILTIRGDKRVGIGTTSPAATLHVVGNTYITGNLGIGTATPSYKLHVEGGTNTAVYGNSSNYTPSVYGYNGYSGGTGVQGQSPYIGVYGYAGAYGLYGVATNSGGYGVYGVNSSGATSSGIGVYGSSSWIGVDGTGNLFGIRGNVTGPSAYAVGAISSNAVGVYAYTGNANSFAGYFLGRVYSSGGYSGSDRKLKEEISDVSDAMKIIGQLQPRTYKFRQDGNYKLMNLPQGRHYGLIAQEVEQVLPDMVAETEFDAARITQNKNEGIINFKALNYTELIPIMVKAMQEQQQQILQQQQANDNLQQQVTEMKNELADMKQLLALLAGGQNITTDFGNAALSAVSPNPARGTASIQYTVPGGSARAQLLITDALGRSIRQLSLSTSGVINLDVSDLAAGVYNYSLIIDNKTVATRKMTVVR